MLKCITITPGKNQVCDKINEQMMSDGIDCRRWSHSLLILMNTLQSPMVKPLVVINKLACKVLMSYNLFFTILFCSILNFEILLAGCKVITFVAILLSLRIYIYIYRQFTEFELGLIRTLYCYCLENWQGFSCIDFLIFFIQ